MNDIPDGALIIQSTLNAKGMPEAHVTLTPSSDKRPKIIDCDPRPQIPVIFLPGVMGTNLKNKDGGSVWSPPNIDGPIGLLKGLGSLASWKGKDAATRQRLLNPGATHVHDTNKIALGDSGLSFEEAKALGWGELHQSSYHGILAYLHHQLNYPMQLGKKNGDWHFPSPSTTATSPIHTPLARVLGTSPTHYGANTGDALTEAMVAHLRHYKYRVHAVGYNWTQSNGDSAKAVYQQIKRICGRYGKGIKAIVITHSMGGIVARSIVAQFSDHEDYIHGVLHGVQPATGAPLAAKRFRTGAEDMAGKAFFGENDAQWAAVSANSPAALELMPMPDYKKGQPWWLIKDAKGEVRLALPKVSAADEIYTSKAWYGLIPEQNDRLLDPAGIVKETDLVVSGKKTVRKVFEDSIDAAKKFQESLIKKYHSHTYVLYGDGLLSDGFETKSAKALMSYGSVVWKGNLAPDVTEADLLAATLSKDDHYGHWQILVRGQAVDLQVQGPDEPGDGTVPANSAAAGTGCDGVQQVFKQGGYDHQFCYDHPWARWATLYAVAQIAQLIPEPADCKKP